MSRNGWIVTAACVLAGTLLAGTLLLGPKRSGGRSQGITLAPATQHAPGLGDTSTSARQRPVNAAGQYTYSHVNRAGQLVEVFGDWIRPKPQGVLEVGWPGMRIHLTATRILEIRSERGTFIAPDNKPRQGEFSGPVVLTLFDGADAKPPTLGNDSADARMRVFMEDATFDLELGRLESAKRIHLTTPRLDFEGTGLTLSYSELHGRMERLVVSHGSAMRLRQDPDARGAAQTSPATRPGAGQVADPRVVYYRAQVSQDVKAQGPDLSAAADEAVVLFAFGPGAGRDRSFKTLGHAHPAPSSTRQTGVWAALRRSLATPNHAVAAAAPDARERPATSPSLPPDRPMVAPAASDTVMTWRGALTVVPLDQAPAELTTPEDIHLTMVGRPVRITTPRKESIRGATLQYATAQGVINVSGDAQSPMVVEAKDLGVVEGERLVVNQTTGIGRVEGGGRLQATSGLSDRGGKAAGGAGTVATWRERMDLTFYVDSPPGAKPSSHPRLRGIRDVIFRGQVRVHDPRFEIEGQLLAVRLSDPVKGKVWMENVQAIEAARLVGRGDDGKPQLDLRANLIRVDATGDGKGRTDPHHLAADGNVDATLPDRHLTCGNLEVELASTAPPSAAKGAATKAADRLAIRSLTATKRVRVRSESDRVQIEADRMLADGQSEYLELFGLPEAPAVIRRPDATVTGPRMTLRQTDQTIDVHGAGAFEFDSQPAESRRPTASKVKPTRVAVTWAKSMRADNRKGVARFVGDVTARSRQQNDTTSLAAPELVLNFEPAAEAKSSAPGAAVAGGTPGTSAKGDPFAQASQALRSVTTHGATSFVAERWMGEPGGDLVSRLTLKGPGLRFDNTAEQVTVDGKGEMLVEDYRVAGDAGAAGGKRAGAGANDAMVHMTGRGVTYFTWVDRMLMDATAGTLAMDGQVQMLHKPAPRGDPVQLDCQTFRATTAGRTGLGAWMGSDQPQASLKAMTAQKDVRVTIKTRMIKSDRLDYAGEDQTVRLTCDPGRVAELSDTSTGETITAEALSWDLRRDRMEVLQPGPVRVPLRK